MAGGKPIIVTVALSEHVFAQGDYVGPTSHGRVMVRIFGRLVSGVPVGPLRPPQAPEPAAPETPPRVVPFPGRRADACPIPAE